MEVHKFTVVILKAIIVINCEFIIILLPYLAMFSKSCQYAIQSLLYIAFHGSETKAIKVKEVSETQGIPIHFLGKIMQTLVRHKILISTKSINFYAKCPFFYSYRQSVPKSHKHKHMKQNDLANNASYSFTNTITLFTRIAVCVP